MTTRLVFLTDAGFLPPTLVALASALASAKAPIEAHLVGWRLTKEEAGRAERIVMRWPRHRLISHILPEEWLVGAVSPKAAITATALGKLFLPRLLEGRALYIDGDTLVRSDLSALMTLDLGGRPLAGVPDWVVARRTAKGEAVRLPHLTDILGGAPPVGYVNSGVLLYDFDRIRQDEELMARMTDLRAAHGFGTVDQDRINQLFVGRILSLDPAWNASWGRLRAHRRNIDLAGGTRAAQLQDLAILHFHGPEKPWGRLTSKLLGKGLRATLAYRRFLARFERDFPGLGPRA